MSDSLVLSYNLFDLPTAQHKAGLAGLLLMIESMKMREIGPVPVVEELSQYSAKVSFTEESMQTVFDDLFDAEWVEVMVKNKWQGKKPKKTEDIEVIKDGKSKKEKRYVYDVLQPKGCFLQTFYPDHNGIWIQLWRDMLWNVLRAQPKTRGVYKDRANNKKSLEPDKIFKSLSTALAAKDKGRSIAKGFAGSVFIGAQDVNAERVSFKGDPINNLLLHFWHIAAFIYTPRAFSLERSKNKGISINWNDHGYVLAIPEPSDLKWFIEEAIEILQNLHVEASGRRPKDAIIDLMEEGGLEYLYQFSKAKFENNAAIDSINAVELYHVSKKDKKVNILSSERLIVDVSVIKEYERMRKTIYNPLFKKVYLKNLISLKKWYYHYDDVVSAYPCELFSYQTGKTPTMLPFFGKDARKKFKAVIEGIHYMDGGDKMSEEGKDSQLSVRVYDLIKQYVKLKAESKSGLLVNRFQKDDNQRIVYPEGYREAVEKVCSDAFLAMRGRREQDFVEYFTGTICSVSQYFAKNDFLLVSQTLLDDWERVKTLSMLALSAHSYLPKHQNKEGG